MSNRLVARRYAKALAEIAVKDGNLERYKQELAEISALVRTNPDMALSPGGPSSHNALGRTLYGPSPFEAPPTKVGGSHLRVTDYR